jgi:hypothetical protein
MMVGGTEYNSFPAPKPLIQKKQVIRRTRRLVRMEFHRQLSCPVVLWLPARP